MIELESLESVIGTGRMFSAAVRGDSNLGPLTQLPGTWRNIGDLAGRGWNMIALPLGRPAGGPYRLLLNQFDETLTFDFVDKNVPNRGLAVALPFDGDQHLLALSYFQSIDQIRAADFPATPDTSDTPKGAQGPTGQPVGIHREPGLFLHLFDKAAPDRDVARLATIPHGDAVLALGSYTQVDGPPDFNDPSLAEMFAPLPIGVEQDIDSAYLAPYKHFQTAPFAGLFDPTRPLDLLASAAAGMNIRRTTIITLDSRNGGGITNIPFVVDQANATEVQFVMWIEELANPDAAGLPQFVMQYAQRVMLDFFPATQPPGGLIKWPHITINTMKWVGKSAPSAP